MLVPLEPQSQNHYSKRNQFHRTSPKLLNNLEEIKENDSGKVRGIWDHFIGPWHESPEEMGEGFKKSQEPDFCMKAIENEQ